MCCTFTRRVDVDAGALQFLDVLPALGMARARDGLLCASSSTSSRCGRRASATVEIEFGQRDAAMFELQRRQDFQALEQGFGVGAAVQFDIADDDIDAVVALAPAPLPASRSSCRHRRWRRRKS